MLHSRALSWVLLTLVASAAAATGRLELEIAGQPPDSRPRIEVRLVVEDRDADPQLGGRVIEAVAPGTVELKLGAGSWTVSAEADGYWSQPVDLEDAGSATRLELWPTGTLRGTLRSAEGEELSETIELLFRSIPGTEESGRIPPDWILCPVTERAWRCEPPAGFLDVQVATSGFVKQFFWDVEVKAGGVTNLGTVEMRRGSSVRGWVLTEQGAPAEGARIELSPRTAASQPDPAAVVRMANLATSSTANHRGFFQLLDMQPGAYVLVAEKESFAPARTTVRVLENEATVIASPPLTIFRPSILEVYVDPPAPPGAGLWQAELVQFDSGYNRIGIFAEESIPANGAWRLEAVPTGFFSLTLSTADGGRWLSETVEVGPNMGPLFVTVPIIEVRGTIRLGSLPLAARLSFGGKYGPQRVYLVADEEGEFAGLLPRAGTWDIAVEVDEPPIRREIQQEVEEGEPLDLVFPDTVVRGVVVDEEGKAVRQAIVRVRNVRQTRMQADLRTAEDGRFESVGLPTGRTVLMAETFQHTSALHELLLEEDREPPEVRLVVRRNTKLEGRVVSETGGGVPGAEVTVMSVEALSMGGPSVGTDAEGRFEAELPPGSRNLVLTVAAPGYALRALQTPFDQGPLAVTVARASGTLILVLPENLSLERWNHKKPLVFHAGGIVSLFALIEWAFLHGQTPESEGRYVIPQVEPGRYAVCLAPLDAFRPLLAGVNPGVPCVAGDLSTAGELTLSLRDASMN